MGQINANLDESRQINELAKNWYHVLCTRFENVPGIPRPKEHSWVATYESRLDYMNFTKNMKACNVHEAKLIHDPVLQRKIESERVRETFHEGWTNKEEKAITPKRKPAARRKKK